MVVGDEFGKDAYGFAHCEVILLFILHHAIDQDLSGELGACKFFLHEFLTDGLDCRPLSSSYHRVLLFLLPELTHSV